MAEPSDPRSAGAPAPPRLERAAPAPAPRPASGPNRGLAAREVTAEAAIAAGLPLEGDLAETSALRLLALCAGTRASGRLTVRPAGGGVALLFRAGALLQVASLDPGDSLAAFLLARRVVGAEDLAAAAAGPGGDDLASALVTRRLLGPSEVVPLVQAHAAELAGRALAAEAGGWRWEPGIAPPPGAFALGSPWALLGAAVRALDVDAVRRRLGERERLGAARVAGRVRPEDLRLTPQEARAATQLDGRRLADVALAAGADAATVLRVALLLAEADLLAFATPRGPAPAATPAAPPAPPPTAGAGAGIAPPIPPRPAAAAPPRPAPAGAAPPPAPRPGAAPGPAPQGTRAPAPPAPAPAPLALADLQAALGRLEGADHFEVLGVSRAATAAQIKTAYFQLARRYHPDAVPAGSAPEARQAASDLFARIGEAWGVLGDDARRATYLEELATGGTAPVDVMNIMRAENLFDDGVKYLKARRYAEAAERFAEATALNAEEPEFGMWRAWCDFLLSPEKRGFHPGAAARIEAELRRNPRCAAGYLFLGQMAKIVGDLPLAERQLRRGLAEAPDHPELQRELKYLRR